MAYDFETKVVVLGQTYTSGLGVTGTRLRKLGLPDGPYTPGVARIVRKQLSAQYPKEQFTIFDYVKQ